mgnify:CR=1 FL=1
MILILIAVMMERTKYAEYKPAEYRGEQRR